MSNKSKPRKVNRPPQELLFTLRKELHLLEQYNAMVKQGRMEYVGDLAAKLRLLVHAQSGAMLVRLMRRYTFDPALPFDGPSPFTMTLPEYLASTFNATQVDGVLVENSVESMVAKWSQQMGGAHQPDAIDADLHATANSPFFVGGLQIGAYAMTKVANTVGAFGYEFLTRAEPPAKGGDKSVQPPPALET